MQVREVDQVVIGAGLAGLVLARALDDRQVVVLDPHPGSYKIGESVIPEQFQDPLLRAVLPAVRQLPSYAAKEGTTFLGDGTVTCFPLVQNAPLAMHVLRQELEALLVRTWQPDLRRERVVAVDLPSRTVHTDQGAWRSRGPIVDCSGPAMAVATLLGDVTPLWPVQATWGYWDAEVDDGAFWQDAAARGWSRAFLDVPSGRLLPEHGPETCPPSRTTILSRIEDGTWMWQIPLRDRRLISIGVVSRSSDVDPDRYRALVAEHHARCYRLTPHVAADGEPLGRVHRRSGFARKASTAASVDHVLVGDAFVFADPVYSLGTGIAVTKALAVAAALRQAPWDADCARRYAASYDRLFEMATRAFDFWYRGEITRDDEVARHVQEHFLVGGAFRRGAFDTYASLVAEVASEVDAGLAADVGRLLDPQASRHVALGWRLGDVQPSFDRRALWTEWSSAAVPWLRVEIAKEAAEVPAYRRIGPLALSYQVAAGAPGLRSGDAASTLLDVLAGHLAEHAPAWLALLDRVDTVRLRG